jgi:hypothetical protein
MMATDPPLIAPSAPESVDDLTNDHQATRVRFDETPTRLSPDILSDFSNDCRDADDIHPTGPPLQAFAEPQTAAKREDTSEHSREQPRPVPSDDFEDVDTDENQQSGPLSLVDSESQVEAEKTDSARHSGGRLRPMSRLWLRRLSRRDTGDSLHSVYPGATNRVVDTAKSQISQVRPQLICPTMEPDDSLSSMKGAHDHNCRLIPSSGIPLVETPAMYIASVHDIEEDGQRGNIPSGVDIAQYQRRI